MATNRSESVRVEGLRDFIRELRALDATLPKEVRSITKDLADDVADKSGQSFSGRSGVAPKVAASVKALAQQRGAQVKFGGPQWPYAMGAEFGSSRYKQFEPWRGSGAGAGYSVFPVVRKERERIVVFFNRGLKHLFAKAFPN